MTDPIDLSLIAESYRKAVNRILFLDYDGTLVLFNDMPARSTLADEVRNILIRLASDPANHIYIISGRTRAFLSREFHGMNVGLIAEHGFVKKEANGDWTTSVNLPGAWKIQVMEMFRELCSQYPGTFVEEKESSLAFHYRRSPVDNVYDEIRKKIRVPFNALQQQFPDIEILEGNKVLEIKPAGFNKGRVADHIVRSGSFDFIMAAGDDLTDEHLFSALPPASFTIRIGDPPTAARFCVPTLNSFIDLLRGLSVIKS